MKKLSFILIFSASFHHLIVTILYLLPVNPAVNFYGAYVNKYMHPFFTQKWELFAPEPAVYSMRMYYRCQNQGKSWGRWKDPIAGLIKEHQANRFTYRGKLLYVYQGLFRELANSKVELFKAKCKTTPGKCIDFDKQVEDLPDYHRVNRLVSHLCSRDGHRGDYQFSLARVYPKPFSKRLDGNAEQKMDVDIFNGNRSL